MIFRFLSYRLLDIVVWTPFLTNVSPVLGMSTNKGYVITDKLDKNIICVFLPSIFCLVFIDSRFAVVHNSTTSPT